VFNSIRVYLTAIKELYTSIDAITQAMANYPPQQPTTTTAEQEAAYIMLTNQLKGD